MTEPDPAVVPEHYRTLAFTEPCHYCPARATVVLQGPTHYRACPKHVSVAVAAWNAERAQQRHD